MTLQKRLDIPGIDRPVPDAVGDAVATQSARIAGSESAPGDS